MSKGNPTKILILEHDENDFELLMYEMKKGDLNFESLLVETKDDFSKALTSYSPDIILSDYSLPGFDGITAFHIKQQTCPHVPFIIVSGTVGEERAVEMIKTGVTDYALKDKLFTVIPKIKRALKEATERQEKAIAEMNLLISERRLAEAQVITKIGSWEISREGDLIACSDEMYRMLDLQPGDALSAQRFMTMVFPKDRPMILKAKASAVAIGSFTPIQFRIITRLGVEKFIEGRCSQRTDASGTSFIGTCQDITEKIKAEQQLKKYSDQIAKERVDHQRKLVHASIESQEKERAEIGRELHDNINQILAVTKAYIEASMEQPDMRDELLLRSVKNLQMAINEIRKISKSLVPPVLNTNGLVDSVNDLIENIRLVNPFAINFHCEKEKLSNLTSKQQLALYRIVQEQFNNIIKHARAHNVIIELTASNNFIDLLIKDDGQGFDPTERRKGVGLTNILSRIELFDGKLEVISSRGTGCTLQVHLPKDAERLMQNA